MADIAAVLDSAGLAGLQAGRNGQKGHPQGAGQGGFIAALMSQMAAEGMPRGNTPDPGGMVAEIASSGKNQPMRAFQPAASRNQEDEVLTAGYPVVAGELDEAGRESPPGRGDGVVAVAEETNPQPTAIAADASVIQPPPGNALAAAIQAISANPTREASISADEGKKHAPTPLRVQVGDSKIRASDPGKTGDGQAGVSANAAGDGGNGGQVLPSAGSDLTEGELSPLQVLSGNTATISVQAGSTSSPASPEVSAARPFEHALRQIEPRVNVSVEAHVKSPAFANEFGEKVVWLAGRQGQMAEMILNPPQLGSVEIRLTVAGGEAGAQFFSANPAVRDAIEAALPKLRDLMAQAGINLGEANVRDQSFAQGKGAERPEATVSGLFPGAEAGVEGGGLGATRLVGLGLVDLYA